MVDAAGSTPVVCLYVVRPLVDGFRRRLFGTLVPCRCARSGGRSLLRTVFLGWTCRFLLQHRRFGHRLDLPMVGPVVLGLVERPPDISPPTDSRGTACDFLRRKTLEAPCRQLA